jgi:predicted glycoside hydrolase/deacetylase ChbG (UPF0249 family)
MKFGLLISICTVFFVACTTIRKTAITKVPHIQDRFLILTADDFGASKNINEGIIIAADNNAITAISVLSNFKESLPDLKKISENHPEIGIGVHLNITTGKPVLGAKQIPSLVNSNGNFYTVEELLPKIKSISIDDLRKELRAQILALVKNDIKPDHLSDQYGILSLYSPFFDIVIEFAKEFNVPIRSPAIASVKYRDLFPNSQINKRGRQIAFKFAVAAPFKAISFLKYARRHEMDKKIQKLDKLGILHPDLLVDSFWGDPTPSNFINILKSLPGGYSEIVIHCGTSTRQDNYPSGLDLDYFKNRENELLTITSDNVKENYRYLRIKPVGYSGLSKDINKCYTLSNTVNK